MGLIVGVPVPEGTYTRCPGCGGAWTHPVVLIAGDWVECSCGSTSLAIVAFRLPFEVGRWRALRWRGYS